MIFKSGNYLVCLFSVLFSDILYAEYPGHTTWKAVDEFKVSDDLQDYLFSGDPWLLRVAGS